MSLAERILRVPRLYAAWQAPFTRGKLAPALPALRAAGPGRLLDLGAGPGTQTPHLAFAHDYVGCDLSSAYAAAGRARHGRPFVTGDARRLPFAEHAFEAVLANSFLHHLDDAGARAALAECARVLAPGGRVHVLDLLLPPRPGLTRILARLDRGDHPRSVEGWRALLTERFRIEHEQPFLLSMCGIALWRMVYWRLEAEPR